MIKKLFIFVLCAMSLASCKFRHVMSKDEYDAIDQATLEYEIDWSEFDEKPTGVTLKFFPTDQTKDTVYTVNSNNVDYVKVSLPNEDYAVICFNQSETEFASLKFDFSSFDGASVMVKEDADTRAIEDITRGYNAKASLKPSSFGTASSKSSKSGTRGYNAKASLKPSSSIKGMSVNVNIFGLNKSVLIKSSISNLAAGVTLHNNKPLSETLNQVIASEDWKVKISDVDTVPSQVSTTFGTFGIDEELFKKRTRSNAEAVEDTMSIILTMTFEMPDQTSATYYIDITDQILDQWEKLISGTNIQEIKEISIQVGSQEDHSDSNGSLTDRRTKLGTIVLHKTYEGMNIGVNGWGNEIPIDINM